MDLVVGQADLTAGNTLLFTLTATMSNDASLTTSVNVIVDIVPPPIYAAFENGVKQVISSIFPATIQVLTYDPDNSPTPFTYAWTCVTLTGAACRDASDAVMTLGTSDHQDLPANSTKPGIPYVFTCVVSKPGRDPVTITLTVSPVAFNIPTVEIFSEQWTYSSQDIVVLWTEPLNPDVNAEEQDFTYKWSLVRGELIQEDGTLVTTFDGSDTSVTDDTLFIGDEFMMIPGSIYTIGCTVT
jgi:hypothetical protein